ncbi:hypothetical protein Ppa06_69630 [Planomonospora parontospora subsp. parontospora]|uniref:HEAT repeat domain-containing protein n=2 Tax=Planomonospora parontospora TaxID=58119 RepID=A0AA37BNQ5_9ACTN|nr:HEAT repeat domain-containing protein [Planomonospora parontospora]GGK95716.1 hypothetical protein GCM10010126_63860 [Planomonospora parontospora]GII13165.1 hypothetical protein Ppa06_69630 [Planomonospora parontospora subsp. parontospora]
MSTADLVSVTLALLLYAVSMLGAVIVTGRIVRRRRDRRDARLAAEARPHLLELTGGDADIDEPLRRLAALDRRRWKAVQPSATSLLGKVSGHAHAALVRLFEERGIARDALRDLTRRGAVRRAAAAHVLGLMHHAEAVPALVRLLSDRNPEVRAVAARALGQVGAPEAAGPLLECLSGGGRVPFDLVAQSLIRIGPAARPALDRALSHSDPAVRAIAAEVLGLIGSVGSVAALVRVLSVDPSVDVRTRAARSLGRLGTPACLAALTDATGLAHPQAVRAEAAGALGDIGAAGAVPALRALLPDYHYRVAHNAAMSLTRLGPPAEAALREVADGTLGVRAAGHAREALAVLALAEGRLPRPAPAT